MMKPGKMRAEVARRFPGLEVQSSSTGVDSASVQIRALSGLRLGIMYKQPFAEMTPDEVGKRFRDWLDKNN